MQRLALIMPVSCARRVPSAAQTPLDKIFSKDTAVHSNIGSSELPPQRDSSKWSSSPVAGRSALPERCYTGAPRGIASASDGATVALALAGSPGAQTRSLNHRPWDAFHASGNAAAPGSASGGLYHSETMDRPSEGPNGSPEKLGRGPRTWAGPGRQTLLPLLLTAGASLLAGLSSAARTLRFISLLAQRRSPVAGGF